MKLLGRSGSVFILLIFSVLATHGANASSTLNAFDVVTAINQERISRGLSVLKIDPALSEAAQNRSTYLAHVGKIFHVTAPEGTPWPEISQVGYIYSLAGENLALGIETPGELSMRWMESPAHRANILEEEFEDIGVGITVGTYEGMTVSYVVSYYGKKKAGTVSANVSQTAPVISSTPIISKNKDASVSPPQVAGSQSVLSLGTPTPAASESVSLIYQEQEIQIFEKLISIFDSYLRNLRMRIGL